MLQIKCRHGASNLKDFLYSTKPFCFNLIFSVQEQSPSLHNENGLLIHNGTHSEPLSCTTSLNVTPLNNINNTKKNSRIMHSTQYLNQFNGANKHSNTIFLSGGGSGKSKGLKMNRFTSFKQNSEKMKKQQHAHFQQQQQTQQQRSVNKKDSVKFWFFKGFNTVRFVYDVKFDKKKSSKNCIHRLNHFKNPSNLP